MSEIAIIGIAGKYPHADDLKEFWSSLKFSQDGVGDYPQERKKDIESYLDFHGADQADRIYRKAGFLEEIDKFDYEFFNIPPNEAKIMDPHQRLLLETIYQALEDAGYCVDDFFDRKIGVFTGFPTEYTCKVYQNLIMETNPDLANSSFSGNLTAMLPARISYFLNLHGPAVLVDTSCSSSLTAIHMACQSIQGKDCELCIASGINIFTVPVVNEIVNAIGIVAPDGKAKSFDDDCEGVGQGEGVGAILLKPLQKAMEDKDHIYAVIKSSAVNQDGKSIGITAPSVAAQEAVLVEAWEKANINPETISYIEAHGTATKLGDPTEISGINRAFKHFTTRKQFCAIGSVKSNIGHTIGAAGVTSVIKLALSLEHKQIPASIHFKKPNRKINFINSAVYVNNKLKIWDEAYPRRCGASSFGISGTNCHVVIEEAPPINPINFQWTYLLFTIKAKSRESLQNLIIKYKKWVDSEKNPDLYNLCYTANRGRREFAYRIAIQVSSIDMLRDKLQFIIDKGLDSASLVPFEQEDIWVSNQVAGDFGKPIYTYNKKIIDNYISHNHEIFQNEKYVKDLGKAYVSGCDISFQKLYKGYEGYKISIPGYAFKKNRCWIDIPKRSVKTAGSFNIYYQPVWKKEKLMAPFVPLRADSSCIIFSNGNALSKELQKKLEAKGIKVIFAAYSDHYECINKQHYLICDDKHHYKKVIQELEVHKLTQIIYHCPVEKKAALIELDEWKSGLDYGIYRFYNLIQVLGDVIDKKTQINLITETTYSVTRAEKYLQSYNAVLIGFAKSIYWEMPSLQCKCMDIDCESQADCILNEINRPNIDYLVCFREGDRYVERIEKADPALFENREFTIKERSTYILIGGNGRIGRRLCKILSDRAANIVIISRSTFINRDLWEHTLEEKIDKGLCEQIQYFLDAEKNDSKVYTYSADVSDYEQMKMIFECIRNEIGPIKGILNCAVDDCGKKIAEQSIAEFKKAIQPKVYGTYVLQQLTTEDKLDFFVTFSSVMTLVSGVATSSYVASNSFLEAFSDYQRKNHCLSMTISWSEWLDVGLSQELMNSEEKSLFKKLPLEKGLAAFEQLLGKNVGRIIVGEINDTSKIYDLIEYLPFQFEDSIKHSLKKNKRIEKSTIAASSVKVKLKGRKTELYTDAEENLAKAYHQVLGYDELNILSNFFEIGGDSISAVKICVALEEYNVNLIPTDILKYQTIEKLAQMVESTNSEMGEQN
jgi:3-oxoacyl-(acyl-carrier-protein) synthase/NADP-dependent 3-hydroxy acid dehydrogenase YdfG/acyl carrier protein